LRKRKELFYLLVSLLFTGVGVCLEFVNHLGNVMSAVVRDNVPWKLRSVKGSLGLWMTDAQDTRYFWDTSVDGRKRGLFWSPTNALPIHQLSLWAYISHPGPNNSVVFDVECHIVRCNHCEKWNLVMQ
jgi:hypothetical protein